MDKHNLNEISEQEFIERIEQAAKKGAQHGSRKKSYIMVILAVVLIAAVGISAFSAIQSFRISNIFALDENVENHDLTLKNFGILGYTVADFAEAIIGDEKQLNKIEVYSAELSDVTTITKAGLAKLKVFTKTQLITYHGTATYVVDLSKLTRDSISVDEDSRTVTLTIPHAERDKINVPSESIEFGDVEKGLLAIGSIKLTPQEISDVETAAKKKMEEKLVEDKANETADRFAKLAVWEMFNPMVTSVSPAYQFEVVFEDESDNENSAA